MKQLIIFLILLVNMSFAGINASLGFGPSKGLLSIGYAFSDNHISANIHLPFYDSDYDFVGGIGISYHFLGKTGPYAFHSSEWINGTFNSFGYSIKDGISSTPKEIERNINYWRLIFGFGYQYMFTSHIGAFFEAGFEFYAGNGGYYTNFDIDYATLDNDKLCFPAGFGITFSF